MHRYVKQSLLNEKHFILIIIIGAAFLYYLPNNLLLNPPTAQEVTPKKLRSGDRYGLSVALGVGKKGNVELAVGV